MNTESQQYRFARMEGHRIICARLEVQFKDGIASLDELEKAIAQQLATDSLCAPWRRSESEQAGRREGMRLAALEFFWEHYQTIKLVHRAYGVYSA